MKALDYILDKEDNFWIVKKVYKRKVYGEMVFKVSDSGRYNSITNNYYEKVIINKPSEITLIKDIKRVFRPRMCYQTNRNNLNKQWGKVCDLLIEIGIKEKDIGIYGSYLIGFDINHDVDFVVYGERSYNLIKKRINYLREKLKVTGISNQHIDYQSIKYKHLYNKKNDLDKIISHNWAGLQFDNGVLSTIRFIKKTKHYINIRGKEKVIKGIVVDNKNTNFLPRIGIIKVGKEKIKVITYFWMFNAFLKKGESVLINGIYNEQSRELYLTNKNHWLKYL